MAPFGKRLMPQALDDHAASSPSRLYASIPKGSNLTSGFQDITCKDMARCVNFMAHWIVEQFGKNECFETIAYIGIPDLRAPAVFLGAVKAGYKVLLPSPRNPPSTNLSLMQQTGCTKVLHTVETAPVIKQLTFENETLVPAQIMSFKEMMGSDPAMFPYDHDFDKVKNDPVVVLHSSGSTGLPKPIVMTHATFSVLDNERFLPRQPGRKNRDFSIWDFPEGGRFYTVFPYFHLAGFLSLLVNPILTESSSPVLGPALMPPSGELLREVMQHQKLRALYLPPSIAEQLILEPNGVEYFKNLDFLCYTGGPFSLEAGEKLSAVTELCPLYGSTEAFQVPQLAPSREDWAWMEWNPCYNLSMRPSDDEEGVFELVLFADESTEKVSALNHNLPGISEYHTKDLFKPHPQKPGLWRYHGRKDDIIVLSNGAKFNPVPMELIIQAHSALSGALVVGQGRVQAALIVEVSPEQDRQNSEALLENIWPIVEKANQAAPGQGRVMRNKILLSNPSKPFTRAGKGTVVRKLTENLYQQEIDDLYARKKDEDIQELPTLQSSIRTVFEPSVVRRFVREAMKNDFPKIEELSDDDNLFSYGMDSLKISQIVTRLTKSLKAADHSKDFSWINARVVFEWPTIKGLSMVLCEFLNYGKLPEGIPPVSRTGKMQECLLSYTEGLTGNAALKEQKGPTSVALIGSTGYLGRYILKNLLESSTVVAIYCLNRDEEAEKRTLTALEMLRKLSVEDRAKFQFVKMEIDQPMFALQENQYRSLELNVDAVIFNSWNPNFGLPLDSFKHFLKGLRTTIDWSIASPKSPRIVFVSSLAGVGNWTEAFPELDSIPELPASRHDVALHHGYGESKCIAEQMLALANKNHGVQVAIIRAGQIGGPSSSDLGIWPVQGWLNALIKSSRLLGTFPGHVSPLDWIPVDSFAKAIVKLVVDSKQERPIRVANAVHPKPVPWSLFIHTLQENFGLNIQEINLQEWLNQLSQFVSEKNKSGMGAVKIFDFLRSLGDGRETDMQCDREEATALLPEVVPLTKELLTEWMIDWNVKSDQEM